MRRVRLWLADRLEVDLRSEQRGVSRRDAPRPAAAVLAVVNVTFALLALAAIRPGVDASATAAARRHRGADLSQEYGHRAAVPFAVKLRVLHEGQRGGAEVLARERRQAVLFQKEHFGEIDEVRQFRRGRVPHLTRNKNL
jgi:hypothetical protein